MFIAKRFCQLQLPLRMNAPISSYALHRFSSSAFQLTWSRFINTSQSMLCAVHIQFPGVWSSLEQPAVGTRFHPQSAIAFAVYGTFPQIDTLTIQNPLCRCAHNQNATRWFGSPICSGSMSQIQNIRDELYCDRWNWLVLKGFAGVAFRTHGILPLPSIFKCTL